MRWEKVGVSGYGLGYQSRRFKLRLAPGGYRLVKALRIELGGGDTVRLLRRKPKGDLTLFVRKPVCPCGMDPLGDTRVPLLRKKTVLSSVPGGAFHTCLTTHLRTNGR
jgi:hypothetical protein